jgi:hypothetical protein
MSLKMYFHPRRLLRFLRRVILTFWFLTLNRKTSTLRCFGRKCCLLVQGDWSRCRWKLKWMGQGGCTRPSFLLPQLLFEILATFLHNRHSCSSKSFQHPCEPNSVTPKTEVALSSEMPEQTCYPTWCKNHKHHHLKEVLSKWSLHVGLLSCFNKDFSSW